MIEFITAHPFITMLFGIWVCYRFEVWPKTSEKGEKVGEYKTYNEAKVKTVEYAKRHSADHDYEYGESEDKHGVFFIISYIGKGILSGIKYILVPVEEKDK